MSVINDGKNDKNCVIGTEKSVCESILQESVVVVCFTQMSVTVARDFAAVRISWVSVIARCLQGES